MPAIPVWYLPVARERKSSVPRDTHFPLPCTVIVPARNEADTLFPILHELTGLVDEILVMDGHSSDGTVEIAQSLNIRVVQDNGRGKGAALRQGILEARNELLVFMDADGSHDPNDIPALIVPLRSGNFDHVSGSRMMGGSDELHATCSQVTRLISTQLVTLIVNYTLGVRLTDCENGFRAIRRSVALDLGLTENIHTIEQEMIIKSLRCGYRVGEVPTHEYPRANGESTLLLTKVWHRFAITLFYYLFIWNPKRRSPTTV